MLELSAASGECSSLQQQNVFVHCAPLQDIDTRNGSRVILQGVCIRWTGPLDWTTGLDYWTHE